MTERTLDHITVLVKSKEHIAFLLTCDQKVCDPNEFSEYFHKRIARDVNICLISFHSILLPFFPGYVGSKSFLEEVLQVVSQLRKANPNLVFGK